MKKSDRDNDFVGLDERRASLWRGLSRGGGPAILRLRRALLRVWLCLPLLSFLTGQVMAQTTPDISISSGVTAIAEGSGGVEILAQSSEELSVDLTVNYTIGGTATPGTDYTIGQWTDYSVKTGTFTMPSGTEALVEFSAFSMAPLSDNIEDPSETIVVTLASGSGYGLGSANTLTIAVVEDTGHAEFELRGIPQVGRTLTLERTVDDPDGNGTIVNRTWRRNEKGETGGITSRIDINGVPHTSPQYVVSEDDLGRELHALLSYIDGLGVKLVRYTPAVGPVVAAPAHFVSVSVEDDASEGDSGTQDQLITMAVSPPVTDGFRIDLCLSGDATHWDDYRIFDGFGVSAGFHEGCYTGGLLISGSGVPAGGQFSIRVIGDREVESDETVILTLKRRGDTPLEVDVSSTNGAATYTILNDDTEGVVISETGASTAVVEGGSGDRYGVALNAEPTHNVTVTVSAGSGVTVNSGGGTQTLTFTPSNWKTAQTITVAAAADSTDDPGSSRSATITHSSSSGDSRFNNLTIESVSVDIRDDDATTVTLAGGGRVKEDGSDSAEVMVTLSRNLVAGETVTAPLSVSGTGITGSDYSLALKTGNSLNRGVALNTADPYSAEAPAVVFTGHGTNTVKVATLVVEGAQDTSREDAIETLTVGFGTVTSTLDRESGAGTGGTTTAGTARVEIADDDGVTVTLSSSAYEVPEGDALTFEVTLSEAQTSDKQFHVGTTTLTAAGNGVDYDSVTRTVTIAANETSGTGTLQTTQDSAKESDETFRIDIVGSALPAGMNLGTPGTATVTIIDDDRTQIGVAGGAAVTEGGTAEFTLTASPAPPAARTVNVTVADSGAFAASGQTGSRTVTMGADGTATLSVATEDDETIEADGQLTVTVKTGTGYTPSSSQATATVTVQDDDTPPTPVVQFASSVSSAGEGAGTRNVVVSLSPAPQSAITLRYTVGGTAISGSDYGALPRTVSVQSGAGSANIPVSITNDSADEPNETIILTLTDSSAAYDLGAVTVHTLTITDNDDPAPPPPPATPVAQFVSASSSASEDAGTHNVAVSLSPVLRSGITLSYTVGGTATSGSDYEALTGTVPVASGAGSVNIPVSITDDGEDETNETVVLTLTSSGADYDLGAVTVHILTITDNDDLAPPPPPATPVAQFVSASSSAGEDAGTHNVAVSLSPVPQSGITLSYRVGGTATSGSDYEALTGTVTVPSGANKVNIPVVITDDGEDEPNETVVLTLTSSGDDYDLGAATVHTLTITDGDDPAPPATPVAQFVSASSSAGEDAGTHNVAVSLSPVPQSGITLGYRVGGTATSGSDYEALTGTVTVPSGANKVNIPVVITHDSEDEPNETVVLTLTSSDADYDLGAATVHTLTITDNDDPAPPPPPATPVAQFVSASSSAGEDAGTHNVAVSFSPAPQSGITLGYLVGGTATSGSDYDALSGTLSVAPGAGSVNIPVSITDDGEDEPNETVVLTLTANSPDYGLGARAAHTLRIIDNDEPPNRRPTGADLTLTLDEDGAHVFRAGDFGFADADGGDALAGIRLATVPEAGALEVHGEGALAGQIVSRAALDGGALVFAPAANEHGAAYASFRFHVSDGEDESLSGNTAAIGVRSVNDAATGAPEITGDPVSGGVLLASVAAVSDVDGMEAAEFSYQWLRVADGREVEIEGASASSYRVAGVDVGAVLKVRVRFTDDAGFGETVTSPGSEAARPVRPWAPAGFTVIAGDGEASLSWQAPESDGGAAITAYEYRFAQGGTIPEGTAWTAAGSGLAATVTGLENGRSHVFEVRAVNSAGPGAAARTTVELPALEAVPGMPRELAAAGGEGEVLLTWTAPLDDGNAAITDYEYRFAEGAHVAPETPWLPAGTDLRERVTGLGDSRQYRFEVRAVNRIGPGPAAFATGETAPRRLDSTAVAGWLGRFGRAAAADTAEAIRRRLEERPRRGLIVGGRHLSAWFGRPRDGEAGGLEARGRLPEARESTFDRNGSGAGFAAGMPRPVAGTGDSGFGADAGWQPRPGARRQPSLGDVLRNSSFFHGLQEDGEKSAADGGWHGWTVWGGAARSRFDAGVSRLSLDAEVDTGTAGFDARRGRWLAGLAISHSAGEGRFSDAEGSPGAAESSLTGVYPYARYQFGPRTGLWGAAGFAAGDLRLISHRSASPAETDMGNFMAVLGGRSVLSAGTVQDSRFELAVRSDALFTRTSAEGGAGIAEADAATTRLRLLLEATGSIAAGEGVLSPTLDAGMRHESGDAETGAGLELGGGLAWRGGPLTVRVKGRGLLAHADEAFEEWGYSAGVQYEPGAGGRGLRVKLTSGRGATFGSAEQLWELPDASGLSQGGEPMPGWRTGLEFGYGLQGDWREALWVPYVGVETHAAGDRALELGVKLYAGDRMDASLEYGRRNSGFEPPRNAIAIKGQIRF